VRGRGRARERAEVVVMEPCTAARRGRGWGRQQNGCGEHREQREGPGSGRRARPTDPCTDPSASTPGRWGLYSI
jgi:hypothetical protein